MIAARSDDYGLGQALARGVDHPPTEGARAALAGVRLARRHGVRMPLLEGLAGVLTGKVAPADAARMAGENVATEE